MARITITPSDPWWQINFKEVIKAHDLIWFLLKRDFVSEYKQTVLGPFWFIIQPLGGTIIFTIIFGKIAKLGTDGIPPILFYHSGLIVWTFFQGCVNGTAGSLKKNAGLYQKVYFPRLVSPIVEILKSFWQFLLNFAIFLGFYFYYLLFTEANLAPNILLIFLPFLLFVAALLGAGIGLMLSCLTVKYRDFTFLTPTLLQLWMYFSPIVYASSIVSEDLQFLYWLNPMVCLLELNRYMFTGAGSMHLSPFIYSFSISCIVFAVGLFLFNKVQQTFVDII